MSNINYPIKVLHYVGKLGSGGVEKLLVSIMETMDRETVSFDFLLWNRNEKGFYDDYVQKLGAELVYMDLDEYENRIKRMLMKSIKFYLFLKSSEYSILHLHGTQPMSYVYAFLAKKAGVKTVIIHAHNTKSMTKFRTNILPVFKLLFGKYPSYYIACSQEAADYMWPKRLEKDKGCVLINGINFDAYAYSEAKRSAFRRENNLEGKYVVGHIGRFAEQKNHQFLLKVFEGVQARIPNSILLLVGEGRLKEHIHEMAERMGIGDKVIFFGTTKDIPFVLMGIDVMCFPSFFEGLGIVAVEAQAASLPVIVSEGVPESANISKYYHKLNLTDSTEKWVDKVCSFFNNSHREDNMQYMNKSPYGVRETATKLVQIYKSLATR